MKKLFVDQDYLNIKLDTEVDLTPYTTVKILWEKEDGTTGEWVGSKEVHPTTGVTSLIGYDLLDGEVDLSGLWKIQAYGVLAGRESYGAIAKIYFYPHL